MTREVIEIESKDAGRVHILTGIVTDTGDGTADVDIDNHGVVSDIPTFYHCPDSETADGNPFSVDDRVLVVNSGSALSPIIANMKVIGFEDGLPRECFWEPWAGPDIITKHPWQTLIDPNGNSPDARLELIENGLYGYIEGALWAYIMTRWRVSYTPPSPEPSGLTMKLKVKADITGPACPSVNSDGIIQLIIGDSNGTYVYFVLAACEGLVMDGARVWLGDNGGEEQTIDLSAYGLADDITYVAMDLRGNVGWAGWYTWRHLHFVS